jgi:1-acyl-sn-glycerol-3-phosphate acyltransferase
MNDPIGASRAFCRLLIFFALTLIAMAVYRASGLGRGQGSRPVAKFWFSASSRLIGLRLVRSGLPVTEGPVLYLANHISYLDILLLGQQLDVTFVAKSEVRDWPLFGTLAELGGTLFVSRRAASTRDEAAQIRSRLAAGGRVILFPEGTSSDGTDVLPFKSALLGLAQDIPGLRIQPVTIAYPHPSRAGVDLRPAWYGDMSLLPHLWQLLQWRRGQAHLRFHPPLRLDQRQIDRKRLAVACQTQIRQGLHQLCALPIGVPSELHGQDAPGWPEAAPEAAFEQAVD